MIFFFLQLFCLSVSAASFKVASFNLQGWANGTQVHYKRLGELLVEQKLLKNVSVLMVQESIESPTPTSAQRLASELGWSSFSERRTSDKEGLGFLYPENTIVRDQQVYQIKAKHSASDYSRMAMSMQIKDKVLGCVRLVNTHLAHQPEMSKTRQKQLAEILIWLRKLEQKSPSDIIIFGGDFNTGPTEAYYQDEFDILSNSEFRFELVKSVGANFTWIDKSAGKKELIDHFFISHRNSFIDLKNSFSKILTHTTQQNFSDHNLVVLNLE